jgi:hypothetical protein
LTKNLRCGLVLSRNLDKNPFTAEKPSIKQGFPVEKRTPITAIIISTLLFSAVAGIGFVNLVFANPWIYRGLDPSPPVNTEISIFSPKNSTAYSSNPTLNFNVSFVNSTDVFVYIRSVYYKASWETENKTVYTWNYYDEHNLNPYDDDPKISEYSYEQNFTNIPEGKQNITITVTASGSYAKGLSAYFFSINESKTVDFTIGITPLSASVLIPIATSGASVAVVSIGLLVYFKKRKRQTGMVEVQ